MAKFLITNEGVGVNPSRLTAFERMGGKHWEFTVDGSRYITSLEEEITAEEFGDVIGSAIDAVGYSIAWENAKDLVIK